MTRDGALFVVPPRRWRLGRGIEKTMLNVLFSTNLHPLADPAVAELCETQRGLTSAFRLLVRRVRERPTLYRRRTVHRCGEEELSPRFDCLLLLRENAGGKEGSSAVKVKYETQLQYTQRKQG